MFSCTVTKNLSLEKVICTEKDLKLPIETAVSCMYMKMTSPHYS